MNLMAFVGGNQSSRKLKQALAQWLNPFPALSLNAVWVGLCLILTACAVYNFIQMQQLRTDISKRRLLENTTQDLLLQSINLRFLASSLNRSDKQKQLEAMGYQSPNELLYQLETRLAILSTMKSDYKLDAPINHLQSQLQSFKSSLNQANETNDERNLRSNIVNQWFLNLTQLSHLIRQIGISQDHQTSVLQRNNMLVSLLVLFSSITLAFINIWKRSKLSKRFEIEVNHLSNQARTDPLTGVLNRRGWMEQTAKHLKRCNQFESACKASLAVLDIDYFKQYNDTFGHEAGDERLKHFASILRQNFRPGDLIARVGGEEFAVMLLDCTVEESKKIVDRIRDSSICDVAFSAGLTNIENHESIVKAMAVADQALYQAKNSGRNCSIIAYH